MNDIIIMNQSQSIGISSRGRALGFGRALGPWALGPVLGTDANVLTLIHDDTIIHLSAIPNPIMVFLKHAKFLNYWYYAFWNRAMVSAYEGLPW